MKKLPILLSFLVFISTGLSTSESNKFNILIAPGTLTENSVTLLWDKQYSKNAVVYEITLNGKLMGSTSKANYTLSNL